MANIWSHLFRGGRSKGESRYTLADAANWIKNAGHDYLLSSTRQRASNEEPIGNNFEAYVRQAFEQNGIVFACMVARMLVFSEARVQYQNMNNGRPGDLFNAPELSLFEEPWPGGQTGDLFTRAIQDADLAGNHYVYTSGVAAKKRIRRMRPDWVDIILSGNPETETEIDILGHIYKPGGTSDPDKWKVFPIDGSNGVVSHWAPIPDPRATFRGMSWLTPVIREIEADGAATRHKAAFFNNAATPNLAVAFKETVTKDQFEGFMEIINSTKTGVEHAYETLYLGGGADVTVIGKDLAQMDFKVTQGAGETRIAAAARIHPVLVGLSEGMQGSSLNAGNYGVAKKAFANGTLRPLWRGLVGAYSVLVPKKPNARLWFDARDIAYLQEDEKDVAEVQKIQSSTITQYVRDGFTPDSAKLAVLEDNVSLLVHTGLFSVQLQRPGADKDPSTDDVTEPKETKSNDEDGGDDGTEGK